MAPVTTQEAALFREDCRTIRVALAYWQARLARQPGLLATEDGRAEWERTARLVAQFS